MVSYKAVYLKRVIADRDKTIKRAGYSIETGKAPHEDDSGSTLLLDQYIGKHSNRSAEA